MIDVCGFGAEAYDDEAEERGEQSGEDGVALGDDLGQVWWMKAVSQTTVTTVPVAMLATAAVAVARLQ